jgi:hypothetical protein
VEARSRAADDGGKVGACGVGAHAIHAASLVAGPDDVLGAGTAGGVVDAEGGAQGGRDGGGGGGGTDGEYGREGCGVFEGKAGAGALVRGCSVCGIAQEADL